MGYTLSPTRPQESAEGTTQSSAAQLHSISQGQGTGATPEARLRFWEQMVTGSGLLLTQQNADGKFQYLSAACRTLLGFSPTALHGRSVYELVHPSDVEQLQATHAALLMHPGQSRTLTYRMRTMYGEYRWLETTCRLHSDVATGTSEILSYSRDVTAQQQDEALRREEREHFLQLGQVGKISQVLLRMDQPIQLLDENAERLLDRINFQGTGLVCVVNATNSPERVWIISEECLPFRTLLLQKCASASYTHRVLHPNGNIYFLAIQATWFTPISGGERQLLVAIEEVTERHAAMATLRRNSWQSRPQPASQLEATIVHKDGVIVEANDAFSQLFGYTPDEVSGMGAEALIAPAWLARVQELIEQGDEHPHAHEARGMRKNGSTFPISLWATRLPQKGLPLRLLSIRDSTASKQAHPWRQNQQSLVHFFLVVGPDDYLVDASHETLQQSGLRREQIAALPPWNLPWWHSGSAAQNRLREALIQSRAGTPHRYLDTLQDPAGTVTQFRITIRTVTGSTHPPLRIVEGIALPETEGVAMNPGERHLTATFSGEAAAGGNTPKEEVSGPLKEQLPTLFGTLCDEYDLLLHRILEQRERLTKEDRDIALGSMVQPLGLVRATPRDLIDIYSAVIARLKTDASATRVGLYRREGQLLLLELMGHLANFFRNAPSDSQFAFASNRDESRARGV